MFQKQIHKVQGHHHNSRSKVTDTELPSNDAVVIMAKQPHMTRSAVEIQTVWLQPLFPIEAVLLRYMAVLLLVLITALESI